MIKFNLSQHNGKIYKVLSGVALGEEVRATYNLDTLDQDNQDEPVIFEIPDSVYSLNSSFFAGLFQKSLATLGEAGFRTKYVFHCNEIIRKNIEDGIFCVLNTTDLLSE